MKLKGKVLHCHTDLIMEPACTSGVMYKIIYEDDEEIAIRDDQGNLHYFTKDPSDDCYFGKWLKLETE